MTRKHFKLLADALKAEKPASHWDSNKAGAMVQWKRDVKAVANACKRANPNFDFEQFYTACDCNLNDFKRFYMACDCNLNETPTLPVE